MIYKDSEVITNEEYKEEELINNNYEYYL